MIGTRPHRSRSFLLGKTVSATEKAATELLNPVAVKAANVASQTDIHEILKTSAGYPTTSPPFVAPVSSDCQKLLALLPPESAAAAGAHCMEIGAEAFAAEGCAALTAAGSSNASKFCNALTPWYKNTYILLGLGAAALVGVVVLKKVL